MPQPLNDRQVDSGLFRIDLPGVHIHDHRQSGLLELPDGQPCIGEGKQAQIRSTAARHVEAAGKQKCRHRKFHKLTGGRFDAERMAGSVWDAIDVVPDGVDAAIVGQAGLSQQGQSPQGFLGDGKTRRPVTDDGRSGRLLDDVFRTLGVLPEFLGREFENQAVPVGVAGSLMASPDDFSNQGRVPLRSPANGKKCRLGAALIEQIEQAERVLLYPGGQAVPLASVHRAGKDFRVEMLLQIHAEHQRCLAGLHGALFHH